MEDFNFLWWLQTAEDFFLFVCFFTIFYKEFIFENLKSNSSHWTFHCKPLQQHIHTEKNKNKNKKKNTEPSHIKYSQ